MNEPLLKFDGLEKGKEYKFTCHIKFSNQAFYSPVQFVIGNTEKKIYSISEYESIRQFHKRVQVNFTFKLK